MMNKKILVVNHDFPPNALAGAEVLTYNHARAMAKHGFEVSVFTATNDKQREGWETFEGLAVYRVYSDVSARWRAYTNIYHHRVAQHFKRVLKKTQPDIVHFHNVHGNLTYFLFYLAKKQTSKIFMTGHDVLSFAYGKIGYFKNRPKLANGDFDYRLPVLYNLRFARLRYNPFRNIFIRWYLKPVKKILCDSHELAKALNQNGFEKAVGFNSCIAADEWQRNEEKVNYYRDTFNLHNKKVILFTSRLSGNKGGNATLKAMERVVSEVPEACLVLLGDNKNPQQPVPEYILYTGRLPHEEVKSLFHLCDVSVTPSLYLDPFPTINLEAMVCKKPVVGTCYGGTKEAVIDGETGYIIDPDDEQVFAEKIITLLKNKELADLMGEAGYKRVTTEFEPLQWLNALLEVYKS